MLTRYLDDWGSLDLSPQTRRTNDANQPRELACATERNRNRLIGILRFRFSCEPNTEIKAPQCQAESLLICQTFPRRGYSIRSQPHYSVN